MNSWLPGTAWRWWRQGGDRVGCANPVVGIGRTVLAWSIAAILAAPAGAQERALAVGQNPDWPWDLVDDLPTGMVRRDRHADCRSAAGGRYVLFQSGGILVDAPYASLAETIRGTGGVCLNGMPLDMAGSEELAFAGYVRAGEDHVFLFNYNSGQPCSRLFRLIVFNAHRQPAIFDGGAIGRCAGDVTMQVIDHHRFGAPRAGSSVEFHFANFDGQGEDEWRRAWRYVDGRLELLSTLPPVRPRRSPR